jgi:hypothetical protein
MGMMTSSSPLESGFYNSSEADYVSEWKLGALLAHSPFEQLPLEMERNVEELVNI